MKNNRNVTISHLYKDEDERWNIQSNEEHTAGVALMSKSFAAEFGLSSWGELIGKMHDRGKERNDFQKYIRSISGYDDNHNRWVTKTHSWIGAKLIQEKYKDRSYILSNAIAGHHRGLYDIDNLEYVINNDIPPEVDTTLPETKLEAPKFRPEQKDITHLTRMLFSCLVDADYLDTERFMNQSAHSKRLIPHDSIETLKTKLDRYLQQLAQKQPSELNEIRNDIQRICRQKSDCASGFYQLTVPTGGGKTIASVIWAINHALSNGKKRVVIAIPFTSIIVQTAQTLRDIFGEENVLEHHSVVADENITDINRLASENWDMPIIVTTNVQLFESIFSNKPSKCRKLHSLCDSVIILDEAQSLPVCMLQPIVNAMQSYAKMFKTSFLFCTASQPVLDHDFKGLGTGKFKGIQAAVEPLIDESMRLHEKLRRVDIKFLISPVQIEKIASDISARDQILCIVNTRRLAARNI